MENSKSENEENLSALPEFLDHYYSKAIIVSRP
jgi:hypothetical protein